MPKKKRKKQRGPERQRHSEVAHGQENQKVQQKRKRKKGTSEERSKS